MAHLNTAAQSMASALTWAEIARVAQVLAARNPQAKAVWGVPAGGIPVAAFTGLPLICPESSSVEHVVAACDPATTLIVDDIADTGRTLAPYIEAGFMVDAICRKTYTPKNIAPHAFTAKGWVIFPWEKSTGPEDAVIRLLQWIGEDPTREGLRDTPKRVTKALREMTAGLRMDPKEALGTVFNESSDQMVIVKGIRFSSLCEHHMLPFSGIATVGYIPNNKVIGLSKIPRLVGIFAKRPQVQERMTNQIAQTLMQELQPLGTGVVIRAKHSCMGCRGVVQPDAEMITSSMLGCLRDDPSARAELMQFCKEG